MTTSTAPGQVATPLCLVPADVLAAASDAQLAQTVAAVLAEQHRRALADADLDALTEEAFATGFGPDGRPRRPWLAAGLVFCPGWIRYKSRTSHDCEFVAAGDVWVWEHPGVVRDVMRQVPGPKVVKQSVTIVLADEGLVLDQVAASAKQGAACQMTRAASYQVRAGELVAVTTRARAKPTHSRT
jgi:hypothetical protein